MIDLEDVDLGEEKESRKKAWDPRLREFWTQEQPRLFDHVLRKLARHYFRYFLDIKAVFWNNVDKDSTLYDTDLFLHVLRVFLTPDLQRAVLSKKRPRQFFLDSVASIFSSMKSFAFDFFVQDIFEATCIKASLRPSQWPDGWPEFLAEYFLDVLPAEATALNSTLVKIAETEDYDNRVSLKRILLRQLRGFSPGNLPESKIRCHSVEANARFSGHFYDEWVTKTDWLKRIPCGGQSWEEAAAKFFGDFSGWTGLLFTRGKKWQADDLLAFLWALYRLSDTQKSVFELKCWWVFCRPAEETRETRRRLCATVFWAVLIPTKQNWDAIDELVDFVELTSSFCDSSMSK